MLLDTIYMIRNGLMGTSSELRFIFSLILIFACILEWKIAKSLDYFWVFIIGTIIWTFVELTLQISGIREMHQNSLFGIEIPFAISIIIQGAFEGATLTLIALIIGDLLLSKNQKSKKGEIFLLSIIFVILILIAFSQAKPYKDIGGNVASRRDMLFMPGMILLISFAIVDVIWFWRRSDIMAKKRAFMIFLIICIMGIVWTIAEVIANIRWIEIGTLDNLQRAPPLIEIGAFAYDIIIEAGTAYVIFFIIPYELGLIKKK
ncbi:MAG: hypothetical protein ACTSQP_04400 [Promethearchaeota archaeon]